MNIIIDTHGESSLLNRDRLIDSDDDDLDFDNIDFHPTKLNIRNDNEKKIKISHNDIDLDEFESDMGWNNKKIKINNKLNVKLSNNDYTIDEIDPIDKVMEKSAIIPGYEQLNTVPRYDMSRRQQLIHSKRERSRTKGKKWFNLPATEMTQDIKHDLQIIQMRSALDPKHFYKKNDMKSLPKYFHIGKVIDSPIDYYNGRLTNKERKMTIVDELMADAEFSKYNKRKYREIINSNRQSHSKAHKHTRKLKGKKK